MMHDDLYYMRQALVQAHKAAAKDEVPVGAVIVDADGKIIARAHNLVEAKKTQGAHAECLAIAQAGKKRGDWRLEECTIYVTLEPCAHCIQLIIMSRVKRLVYGAASPLFGYTLDTHGMVSIYKNSHFLTSVVAGIEAQESARLMQQFFKNKRVHSG
jgi:tRNA(adenine34) deaminase